ncbi:MAG: hypothetical protein R2793_10485, partial [Flavobacteriaceae bacterium]
MKKTLFIALMITSYSFFGQNEATPSNETAKHELKIDGLEGLIVPAIDISYEYLLSAHSGAGVFTFINLDNTTYDYQKLTVGAYYRQYVFNKEDKYAKGFFAEGLLQYGTGENYNFYYDEIDNYVEVKENWSRVGVGATLGYKWVSGNGFIIEISGGGGRYFDSDSLGFFK